MRQDELYCAQLFDMADEDGSGKLELDEMVALGEKERQRDRETESTLTNAHKHTSTQAHKHTYTHTSTNTHTHTCAPAHTVVFSLGVGF